MINQTSTLTDELMFTYYVEPTDCAEQDAAFDAIAEEAYQAQLNTYDEQCLDIPF
jgi:hypothetical protein